MVKLSKENHFERHAQEEKLCLQTECISHNWMCPIIGCVQQVELLNRTEL